MTNKRISQREKSIIFIGFMGVGKTTIGKLVAQKLHRTFIDIDDVIVNEYNKPITDIFNSIGEKAFRAKEKELIHKYCTQKLKVISLGGGAFLQEEIRDLCLSNCIVIALYMSWDKWKERLNLIIDSRPVLQGKSLEEIEELFYKRQETYALNHSKISIDSLEIDEIVENVTESLKLSWELHDR